MRVLSHLSSLSVSPRTGGVNERCSIHVSSRSRRTIQLRATLCSSKAVLVGGTGHVASGVELGYLWV